MEIDIMTLSTIVSVSAAVYFGAKSREKQQDDDVSRKAGETATINQKLDNISEDTKDIKKEISDVKRNVNELSERVVIVEQSTKSAHHRIDSFEADEYGMRKRRRGFFR